MSFPTYFMIEEVNETVSSLKPRPEKQQDHMAFMTNTSDSLQACRYKDDELMCST